LPAATADRFQKARLAPENNDRERMSPSMSRRTRAAVVAGATLLGACSRTIAQLSAKAVMTSTEQVEVLMPLGVISFVAPRRLEPQNERATYTLPNGIRPSDDGRFH
jgi:hypothetical protein